MIDQHSELANIMSKAVLKALEDSGFKEDLEEPKGNVGLRRFVERHMENFAYTLQTGFVRKVEEEK